MKKQMVLQPEYMSRFECIGPACEDSCCSGWRVTVDAATYKKYTKANEPTLAPLFDKQVTRVRSNSSPTNYAKIRMTQQGHCPFLNEEKLCGIQQKLGESYLSDTCAIYPRTINKLDEVIEKSAAMSCPEIARLALLNPDGISFEEKEELSGDRTMVHNRKETQSLAKANKIDRYFWELRIFTIEILQNRQYSVDDRLIFLGMFYQKLQSLVSQEKLAEIPQLVTTYKHLLEQEAIKDELANIPSYVGIQMKLSKELMDQRLSGGVNNQRYMDCLVQYLHGIKYYKESTVEENTVRYQEAYEAYYAPYMKDREYILENYLVNYVFRKMFPLTSEKTVFDAYVMLVVNYALVKLHLIGLAGYHKGLNEEIIVKFVQSFSRMVEHNTGYLTKIYTILKENEYTTMPYMSILIKN
jgi:lysine-N-methylase